MRHLTTKLILYTICQWELISSTETKMRSRKILPLAVSKITTLKNRRKGCESLGTWFYCPFKKNPSFRFHFYFSTAAFCIFPFSVISYHVFSSYHVIYISSYIPLPASTIFFLFFNFTSLTDQISSTQWMFYGWFFLDLIFKRLQIFSYVTHILIEKKVLQVL